MRLLDNKYLRTLSATTILNEIRRAIYDEAGDVFVTECHDEDFLTSAADVRQAIPL